MLIFVDFALFVVQENFRLGLTLVVDMLFLAAAESEWRIRYSFRFCHQSVQSVAVSCTV